MNATSRMEMFDLTARCLWIAMLLFSLTISLCAAQSHNPANFRWHDSIASTRSLTRLLAYIDSADIATRFTIEKAERQLEFGLVSYDFTWLVRYEGHIGGVGRGRIAAIDDTVIMVWIILDFDSITYYDVPRWNRWNARMMRLYGTPGDSMNPASAEHVAVLTAPFFFLAIGQGCGWASTPPRGYCAVVRLIELHDLAALRRVLHGPNVEGRIYAWLALERFAATEDVGVDLEAAQRRIERAAIYSGVPTCGGCSRGSEAPGNLLERNFLGESSRSSLGFQARKCFEGR